MTEARSITFAHAGTLALPGPAPSATSAYEQGAAARAVGLRARLAPVGWIGVVIQRNQRPLRAGHRWAGERRGVTQEDAGQHGVGTGGAIHDDRYRRPSGHRDRERHPRAL